MEVKQMVNFILFNGGDLDGQRREVEPGERLPSFLQKFSHEEGLQIYYKTDDVNRLQTGQKVYNYKLGEIK